MSLLFFSKKIEHWDSFYLIVNIHLTLDGYICAIKIKQNDIKQYFPIFSSKG